MQNWQYLGGGSAQSFNNDKYNQKSEYFEEGMVSLGASKELKDVEEYHNDIHVEEDGSEDVVFSAEAVVV